MVFLFSLLGLLAGALVNALATDFGQHRRPALPYCPECRHSRPWWQWLALPALAAGHGRCTRCDARIGIRHVLVEIGLSAAFVLLWLQLGLSATLVLSLLYTIILAIIVVTDLEHHIIPNALIFPSIGLAIVASFVTPGLVWWHALLGGVFCLVPFLVAKAVGSLVLGPGSLGGGDLKLALFVGLITGMPLALFALVLATILGALSALALLVTRRRGMLDAVPYGPFLAIGGWVALVWGDVILGWLASG